MTTLYVHDQGAKVRKQDEQLVVIPNSGVYL
jgi:hypothetical protein